MRIGLFTDTYPPEINGVANSTHIVFREMMKHGHDVYVVCTRKGIFKAEWDESHRILRLAGIRLKSIYGYNLTAPVHPFAIDEIRALHLDIIHVQTEFGVGIFAHQCARELHIPIVMTYHTTYEDYVHYVNFIHSDKLDRQMKNRVGDVTKLYADASMEVIVPSEKTKESLLDNRIFKKINVIPTGLELEQFSRSCYSLEKTREIRNEYGFSMDDRVVIYVGRIAEEKALDLVIRGFAQAVREGTDAKLLVVGGGPDLGRLKKMAKNERLGCHAAFAGPKDPSLIPDLYRCANAFISASLSETQGMTFIEALASGLPVFARRDEVLEDLVIDGKTGWYFDDEADLARVLKNFYAMDTADLEEISRSCEKKAQPYSSRVFYEDLMAVYNRVIDDYEDMYTLKSVKAKDSSFICTISRGLEPEITVEVSLDDFYEYGLRKGRGISVSVLKSLQYSEKENQAYRRCLNKLSVKDRSVFEIRSWLRDNTECDENQINAIIDRLSDNGYLNDELYCENEVLRLQTRLYGNKKIRYELQQKGIDEKLIERMLQKHEDQSDAAMRLAEKTMRTHKTASSRRIDDLIRMKLVQYGFSPEMANSVIAKLDHSRAAENEHDNLERQIEKAKRKYSRKYSGRELKARVYKACMQLGFSSDDTLAVLDGMEWTYEEDQ